MNLKKPAVWLSVLAFVCLLVWACTLALALLSGHRPSDSQWRLIAWAFCGMVLLSTAAFVLWGIQHVQDQVEAQLAQGGKYNKRNDSHWCGGVFGTVGGLLLLLLNGRDVVALVASHALSVIAIVLFALGIQSYFTWRWKRPILMAQETLSSGSKALEELELSIRETDELLERLEVAQQGSAGDSPTSGDAAGGLPGWESAQPPSPGSSDSLPRPPQG